MTVIIIAAVAIIGAACLAGLALLAYLLRRDRDLLWRPGDLLPEAPAETAPRSQIVMAAGAPRRNQRESGQLLRHRCDLGKHARHDTLEQGASVENGLPGQHA